MKNTIFNWQKFLIFFGITFGFGILAMLGSNEGFLYYIYNMDVFDAGISIATLALVIFISCEKKGVS